MQINATQGLIRSAVNSAQRGGDSQSDFQALLSAAGQKLEQNGDGVMAVESTPSSDSDRSNRVDALLGAKTAAQELAEYASKSVAEHVRDAVLKDMGLTEEDLAAMPPEQRAAIEDEIARRVAQALSGLTDPRAQKRQVALADPSELSPTALAT